MKRLFAILSTIVALVAVASCAKEKTVSPKENVNVRVLGTLSESKTGIIVNGDGTYSPYWLNGDKIGVYFDALAEKDPATLTNSADDLDKADFDGEVSGVTLKDDGKIYAFYPRSAYAASSTSVVRLTVPGKQHPAAVDTFDPAADILIGKPSDYTSEDNYVVSEVAFARVLSVLRVNLNAVNGCPEGLNVTSFKMEVPEAVTLTGRVSLSFSAASKEANPITEWTVKDPSVSALYDEDFHPVIGGQENTIFVMVNPTTVPAGSKVSFTMLAEKDGVNYEVTKEIASIPNDFKFPLGNVANLNLSIAAENVKELAPETRIYADDFGKVTENKTKPQPAATGALGSGLNEETKYTYGGDNTNIRFNSNGHSATDPYLYLSQANDSFTISNIAVSNEKSLVFAAQTKNAGSVKVEYKESSAETWSTAATWTSTASFTEQSVVFTISTTVTSLDLRLTNSGAAVIVDDLELETFVDKRVPLDVPANFTASVDGATTNKINVSWGAVQNAGSYELVLSTEGESDITKTVTEANASFSGLKYSTAYTVKVKAVSSDATLYLDSDYTAPASVTTGAKPATGETWEATAFADIASDDELVIVGNDGDYYAMSNDNGTSNPPTAVSISVTSTGDELESKPEEKLIWIAEKDASGNITFYTSDSKDKWLYCTATNNGVRVGTNANKTFILDSESGYLKHIGTSRYVGIYNSADWRCYTSTTGNIAGQTFNFFVKKGGVKTYNVTCSTVEGGTLSADPAKAAEGATVTLTAKPASDEFVFNNDWSVKGADNTPVTVSGNTFVMPAQNVTVTASFSVKTYDITKTPATNGSFTVKAGDAEVSEAAKGTKITLAAVPAEGYKFDGFTVKETVSGNAVTVSSNTFTMPGVAVTVSAAFSEKVDPGYEGQGTADDPYTVSDVIMIATDLGSGGVTAEEWYGVGIISSITEVSTQYGNATYIIRDKKDATKTVTVYRGKYLNNVAFTSANQINVNDEVVVYGKIKNYGGTTMEFDADNYIYSIKAAPKYKVNLATVANGSLSADFSEAAEGQVVTITATPNDGYKLKEGSITVTKASTGTVAVSGNKFTMPAEAVTVSAEFEVNTDPKSEKTATITFGTNNVKIDAASVTGKDDKNNSWTITTAGTSSFTQNAAYSQVGSSNKPATSITFTTTLPSDAEVTSISAKFGGFNGTAGTVTLKVGDNSVGTGSLNAANDVTVTSTSTASGNVITITVTSIAKGVKVYNIVTKYKSAN